MHHIAQRTRGVTQLVWLNMDRFLVPLMITAALTLAGWVLSLS